MSSERVVVSAEEVTRIKPLVHAPPNVFEKLPSPVPWWARVGLALLVPLLPLLAIVTVILRIAFRQQPRSVRFAWVSFLSTLLVVSGLLTTLSGVLVVSFVPLPAIVNTGLPELDEREQFAILPAAADLTSAEASAKLKPLVVVVSPATRLWNSQEVASNEFGAGALLHADKDGYLFATANHVVNRGGAHATTLPDHALLATVSGVWATGTVVGINPRLDLALVWIARHAGAAEFVEPVAQPKDGAEIFVIGHPEGLKYTLSTGIISDLREETVQISAAVSPGNSGGPVYDRKGELMGIVSAKFDHTVDPNAENLGFATSAEAFQRTAGWIFQSKGPADGRKLLETYIKANRKLATAAQP